MANIDEKDALNCLLDDALTYKDAIHYGDISKYLVDEFGYEEYVEDARGFYMKNPALKVIENGLREQYNKACNILHGKAKIIDLLEEFREEYDY
jgi:hypothetical protein